MATLLLIRHGQTRANADGVLAGRAPGVLLDERGHEQAQALAGRLRDVPLAAVVHSPLERCAQTAAILVGDRTSAPRPVADARLLECDYGTWTGRLLADLAREPLWATVMRTPSAVRFPGGERMAAMAARAVACAEQWGRRGDPGDVVALVTHGDVVKAILSHALGQRLDRFQRIAAAPGSLSVVAWGGRPVVVTMNDTGALPALGPGAAQPVVGGGATPSSGPSRSRSAH